MVNGFTPLPFGQVEQVQFGKSRQLGLERQQKNIQAEQTQFQNDLLLTDSVRKLQGVDKALEFWKTTPSSARFSFDKFQEEPGKFSILKITEGGTTVGGIKVFDDPNIPAEEIDPSLFPAVAPKAPKPLTPKEQDISAVAESILREDLAQLNFTPDERALQKIAVDARVKARQRVEGKGAAAALKAPKLSVAVQEDLASRNLGLDATPFQIEQSIKRVESKKEASAIRVSAARGLAAIQAQIEARPDTAIPDASLQKNHKS